MNDGTNKTKLEVLKMARELLNEEYINRRAEDHNRWIAECDVAWKTKGIKLAYPPFAPYPCQPPDAPRPELAPPFDAQRPAKS